MAATVVFPWLLVFYKVQLVLDAQGQVVPCSR